MNHDDYVVVTVTYGSTLTLNKKVEEIEHSLLGFEDLIWFQEVT